MVRTKEEEIEEQFDLQERTLFCKRSRACPSHDLMLFFSEQAFSVDRRSRFILLINS